MFITLYNQFAWLCRLYCHACLFKKHLFRIFFFFLQWTMLNFFVLGWQKGWISLKTSAFWDAEVLLINPDLGTSQFLSPCKHRSYRRKKLLYFCVHLGCHDLSLNKTKKCTFILPEQYERLNSALLSLYSRIAPTDTKLNLPIRNIEATEGSIMINIICYFCVAKQSLQFTIAGTKSTHPPLYQYDNRKN